MATRYTVAPGHEFNYPDEAGERLIKYAGGRSKMLPDALAKIKFKTVTEGQDCGDMPKESLALYLERGWVIASEVEGKAPTKKEKES